jgi:excinuclease ABC subunit C
MLKDKLQSLPNDSGVYQYFDENGHLLYIGKAKNLKNRVKSYFRFTPELRPADNLSPRIFNMISKTVDLRYIVVDSENDALILENSLIKQLKPKYNILLRDDKTYPYIYIDFAQSYPRLEITRKILKGKVKYFGPFPNGANELLDAIYEILPLVQKKSCIAGKKACLFYQIKKCHAPCEGKITTAEYAKIVDEAIELISNKDKIIEYLTNRMMDLAEQLRYEEAGKCKEQIEAIKKSKLSSSIDIAKLEDIDIFAIRANSKRVYIVKIFMRNGKIVSSSHDSIRYTEYYDEQETYKRAIMNLYNSEIALPPKQIITAIELEEKEELETFLESKLKRKVAITCPQRGEKKRLIELANKNLDELLSHEKNEEDIKEIIKEALRLENYPSRIEVFDNSHMMSEAKVGAMVVYEDDFVKESYRHYNLEANDEYAQMRELLTRRCESFDKSAPPDLWVIDGGQALLDLAVSISESCGVYIDVVAIAKEKIDAKAHRAKGKANDIIYLKDEVLRYSNSDKRLHFVQRLRDEAHRFAITFHRKQKQKKDKEISLLKVKGIGDAKIKKLLSYFDKFENIKNAPQTELEMVLNSKDAKSIYDYFHMQVSDT